MNDEHSALVENAKKRLAAEQEEIEQRRRSADRFGSNRAHTVKQD